MKLLLEIEVITHDGSSPFEQDVVDALTHTISRSSLSWNDPSLDRRIYAKMDVLSAKEIE